MSLPDKIAITIAALITSAGICFAIFILTSSPASLGIPLKQVSGVTPTATPTLTAK